MMVSVGANSSWVFVAWRLALIAGYFIAVFFYHTVYVFTDNKNRLFLFLSYLFITIAAISTLFLNDIVIPHFRLVFKSLYFPIATPSYSIIYVGWGLIAINALAELVRFSKSAEGIKRVQAKYMIIAFTIGFLGGGQTLWSSWGISAYPIGNFGVAFYGIIGTYAILRHHLLDIRIAGARAGIFALVYAFVLGIPFGLAGWGEEWLISRFGQGWFWAPMVLLLVLATTGPFLYNYLRKRAEETLLKERRLYQKIINNLSENMIDIRDIGKLLSTISVTIGEAVKLKSVLIYLKQEEYKSFQLKSCYPEEAKSQFQELVPLEHSLVGILEQRRKPMLSEEVGCQDKIIPDTGVVIPLLGKSGLLGFVVLGAKASNQMYTSDDLLVMETFSYNAGASIENCLFWKEIEDRHRKARLHEMDTFAYSLAHEIDNPLNFVRNLSLFLKERVLKNVTDEKEKKDIAEMCDHIFEGSNRVMGMVEAIRKFGEKSTGEFVTLKLQEVIDGFFKLYGPELEFYSVTYSKDIPEEAIYVKGVAAELQQVLIILAKNAVHAMTYASEKRLVFKVTKLNSSIVRVSVADSGYGIPAENLHGIFEPFFTTKASSEGTGMGLHNAKGFISRHNGRIWAESEGKDKGATFIFEIPITQDVVVEDTKPKGRIIQDY